MPEFIKTAEVIGTVLQKAQAAAHFVIDRMQTGAWGDLPHPPVVQGTPPQRPPEAHIEYISTGEPHDEFPS